MVLQAAAWVLSVVSIVGGTGCTGRPREPGGRSSGEHGKQTRGLVIATVGDQEITADDLEAELAALEPAVRLRFSSPERKKALLEQLVQRELLAQEALRRGLNRDPEVAARFRRVMAEAMIATLRQELVKLESIEDSEVLAFYRRHRADFPDDFEQERARVQNELFELRRKEALQRHLADLRKRAHIEVQEQRLAEAARATSTETPSTAPSTRESR